MSSRTIFIDFSVQKWPFSIFWLTCRSRLEFGTLMWAPKVLLSLGGSNDFGGVVSDSVLQYQESKQGKGDVAISQD